MNEIEISNKNYTEWKTSSETLENPFSHKLFHKDRFDIVNNIPIIRDSPTRNATFLPGILILEHNRTFGRTSNKKRLYYSCVPNQSQLPIFLVPYEIQFGFNKNIKNKYVLFRFDHWLSSEKHPYGILVQTIGDVDILPHYYEYRLYAKNIHPTNLVSKCNKKIKDFLKQTPLSTYIHTILNNPEEYGYIEDYSNNNEFIFTIDPSGCVDRDDALSISITDNPHIFKIQVYIANVWLWIKLFDLWELLEKTNCSTIYLPDFNRNMLPTELSENICSLDEGECSHFTFVMEFEINTSEKTLKPIYKNTNRDIITQRNIHISNNFDYESKPLLKYIPYNLLLQKTREINPEIKDSHELVAFWMMQMNTFLAKEMYSKKIGIFRTTTSSNNNKNTTLNTTSSFLHIWEHAISGKYIEYSDSDEYHHQILNVSHYMHFTSPIRRKVDIYNQLCWMAEYNMDVFPRLYIDSINEDTKKIRKIQNECTLLYTLQQSSREDEEIDGIILQIITTEKVLVYLPTYKSILSCKYSCCKELYMSVKCKIYIFERESDYKMKIQLCIL